MTDGLTLLTGPDAGDLMAAVLTAAGGDLLRWHTRQVDHQPDTGTTASYRAHVRWADGTETAETLGACHGTLPPATTRLTDGTTEIGMWRFPHDPDLPGLPRATDPTSAGHLAAHLGIGDGSPARIRLRAYRPRRRAVLQIRTRTGDLYLKAVRPHRAPALHERHRAATAAGCPVPAPLGHTDDGLVALTALPGRTLRDELLADTPGSADTAVHLDPDAVTDLLDHLPALDHRTRPTWGQKAPHYARVITDIAPDLGPWATDIAAAVDHHSPHGPPVPIHGDFYETQFMIADGRPTGLLDIDTACLGERLDDAACLLAHLSVLAHLRPARATAITELGTAMQRRFERDLDPHHLRLRTAAAVLSLATGPHRVQEPHWHDRTRDRLHLAQRWLDWS